MPDTLQFDRLETSRDEERCRQMFEENRVVQVLIDPTTGAVIDANLAACEFYGYPREVLIGKYIVITASGHEERVWEQGRGVSAPAGKVVALEGFAADASERILTYQTLEQRVADRTRELAALYDIAAVASESLDLKTTLTKSLEHVLAVMGCEAGTIYLLHEASQQLELAASRGISAEAIEGVRRLALGSGLISLVVEQGEPLVAPEIVRAPRPLLAIPAHPSQAFVGVPMRARGQVLGALAIVGKPGRQFDANEVALLASIADQIGVAAENARLYKSEQERRRQADILLEAASVVGSTLELDQVLDRILDQLYQVVRFDSASIQLLEGDSLRVIAARGFADPTQVLNATFPLGGGFPNRKVIEEGQPMNLANTPTIYPEFREPPFRHIQSWLGVPLRVQERVIGMITLDREQPSAFDEEEVRMVTAFAHQVALALEKARLYRQAEQLAVLKERGRLARELHDSVTQSLYSALLLAEAGRRQAAAGNVELLEDYMTRLGEMAQQALREMRLLVYELRPTALAQEGLIGTLQHRLDAVEGRAGVEARLLVEGGSEVPAQLEEGLYRIAQEALNNALKHSHATAVTVRVCADSEKVELEIADNGQGFVPTRIGKHGGMGMTSMQERAERLGGRLDIDSAPGEGTRVKVVITGLPR